MGRLALIVVGAWLALFGAQPEPSPAPSEVAETPVPAPRAARTPSPYAILNKGREVFRAHVRPPFIVYTLERREWMDMQPDVDNSYTWRIWCRTKDDAAMTRIFYRKRNRALAELHFIKPGFYQAVDPGPPTGDIFPYAPPPTPKPQPSESGAPRTIAVVGATADTDYRATYAGIDAGSYHLKLEPVRDRERNRLREVWFDVATLEVRRVISTDRLFLTGEQVVIEGRSDIRFAMHDGVPVLFRIRAVTDIPPTLGRLARREETEYLYDDLDFETKLPDWYFDPKTYRGHFHEAPSL